MRNSLEVIGNVKASALSLAAIDFETTGLDPWSAHALEVGMVPMDGSDVLHALIRLPGQCTVPQDAARLHGITTERAWYGHEPSGVGAELCTIALRSVMVAHNIGYDFAVLSQMCGPAVRRLLAPAFATSICTLALSVLRSRSLTCVSLQAMCSDLLGEERCSAGIAHTALQDARDTAQIFSALVPRLIAMGEVPTDPTLLDLVRATDRGIALARRLAEDRGEEFFAVQHFDRCAAEFGRPTLEGA